MLKHYEATRGFVPNSVRTMARRPEIAKSFARLNQAILYEGTVDKGLKMLISLMSSLAAGCRYCQSHMTNLSNIYEVPHEKIAALWTFEGSEHFTEAEKAALNLAIKAARVPNEAESSDFDQLRQHYDDAQIVEIVACVALFGYLNRWNDTMATSLEEYPQRITEDILSHVDWDRGKHQ